MRPNRDARGYFARAYDEQLYAERGLHRRWVQENQSLSTRRGTIRGLHFQRPDSAETKLVRAIAGVVWDVLLDLRVGSPTYGQWEAVELDAEAQNMAYVPRGFAHGFCSLTDGACVLYKVDARYAPEAEGGLRWDDPALAIPWPLSAPPVISEKDAALPPWAAFVSPFRYDAAADDIPRGSR